MKRSIIILFALFAKLIVTAQLSDSLLISTGEIKSFFAETRKIIDNRRQFRVTDNPDTSMSQQFLEMILKEDSVLNKKDIPFILKQIKQRMNTIWDNTLIDSATIIKSADIDLVFKNVNLENAWANFYEKYGGGFYKMSLPYFSQDKQTCVICVDYFCGELCGEGTFKIFRRKGNIWTLYNSIRLWVS